MAHNVRVVPSNSYMVKAEITNYVAYAFKNMTNGTIVPSNSHVVEVTIMSRCVMSQTWRHNGHCSSGDVDYLDLTATGPLLHLTFNLSNASHSCY